VEAAEVAGIVEVPEVALLPEQALLQVKMVGMCGTDLNTYRGRNAMVTFPRVLGHEIAAVVVEGDGDLPAGTPVTMAPYTNCGICPACLRGRVNACQRNETMGVQRDGAITEYIRVPRAKLYPAKFVDQGPLPGRAADGWIPRGGTRASELRVCDRSFRLRLRLRLRLRRRGAGSHRRLGIRGAETIAIDMDDRKLATARRAGARHAINTAREDLHTRLQEITSGRGPDVIIEAIGCRQPFAQR
jgi:threonine dehydrogenase-like Zn-dependent dehydrogenase